MSKIIKYVRQKFEPDLQDQLMMVEPVSKYMHQDFVTFNEDSTVKGTISRIRKIKDEGKIIYFYTVDGKGRLTGVVPVRKLLTGEPLKKLKDISKKDLVTVSSDETLYDVAKAFESYKFLSLPVVDGKNKVKGVIDLNIFLKKEIDISNKYVLDEAFQTIGIRISKIATAGAVRAFRHRFPWLISTILAGIACAFLAGVFEVVLVKSVILSFFLVVILALGESTSIQSMSIVFQRLYTSKINIFDYLKTLFKEIRVGILIGLSSALIVFAIALLWKNVLNISLVIGISIVLAIVNACVIGLTIPMILFSLKINPKVSAGPIVLAITDVCTLAIYLTVAALILK
jgi:magnesium transporter